MKANETRVEDFLSNAKTQFVIPLYQRNYSWNIEQCKQLFTDILETAAHDEKNAAYFIGSIVYVQDNHATTSSTKEFIIVDGQQRLTTLTLIYIVLYLKAQALGNTHLAAEIYETYLTNKFSEDAEKIKLKPIEGDDAALAHLLNGKDSKEYCDQSKIIDAFSYFHNHIDNEKFQKVREGLSKLMFVEIALDRTYDDPQKIFESLNSTGLNLSQADLIRNYILMGRNSNEQKKLYKDYWEIIETHAKDEEGNDTTKVDASAFIRDYLTLKDKNIHPKGKVYFAFKKKYPLREFEQLKTDLAEMVRLVKLYHKLINPKKEYDKNIQTELEYLHMLDVSVAHPFLMKVYDDYVTQQHIDTKTFIAVLQLVQSFVFRRTIIDLPTNVLNKLFMSLYDKIDTDNYLYSIQEILLKKSGNARFPHNTEVEQSLKQKEIYNMNTKNKKYLFDRLENHKNKERVLIDNLTIEHIFPQKPDKIWIDELGKDDCDTISENYLHTIGNLTLSGNNSNLGNKSFQEKRDLQENGYKNSRLWLNKSLSFLNTWNGKKIEKRCKELTERFFNVWKFPTITINEREDEVNFLDVDDPTDTKPKYIIFMDEKILTNSWRKLYQEILIRLFNFRQELFFSEKMKERINLQKNKKIFRNPLPINDIYFVEGNFSSKHIVNEIKSILTICNLEDELTITFSHSD